MQEIGREDIQIIAKHSNWSSKGVSKALVARAQEEWGIQGIVAYTLKENLATQEAFTRGTQMLCLVLLPPLRIDVKSSIPQKQTTRSSEET